MATRNGSAEWRGDLREGSGSLSLGSGLFSGAYSFKTRFEEEPGTNPEELIAAAHASCFSMALSNILSEAGHVPESVSTTAKVHLRQVDGAPTIAQIDLETEGRVPASTSSSSRTTRVRLRRDVPSRARSELCPK